MVCVILLRSRDRGSLYSLAQHALQTYREGLPRLRFHLTDLRAGLADLIDLRESLADLTDLPREPRRPHRPTARGARKSIAYPIALINLPRELVNLSRNMVQ